MANKKIHELPITNNFNDGNLKIPVSDGSTTYSMDVTGYTQSILSGVTISGDYLPLSGGAMTGNIESFEGFALYSDNGVNTLGLYYGTSGSDGIITESLNSGGTFSRITIRDGSIEVLSNDINFSGITYDVDYSPNFTNRSLVDKEYVDNQIQPYIPPYSEIIIKYSVENGVPIIHNILNTTEIAGTGQPSDFTLTWRQNDEQFRLTSNIGAVFGNNNLLVDIFFSGGYSSPFCTFYGYPVVNQNMIEFAILANGDPTPTNAWVGSSSLPIGDFFINEASIHIIIRPDGFV